MHGNIWKDQFSHNFIEFLLHTLASYCLLVISARIWKENIENHYLMTTYIGNCNERIFFIVKISQSYFDYKFFG